MTGTLATNEPHPAIDSAHIWYTSHITMQKELEYLEYFASCAIEDNRLADVCFETLRRLAEGEQVSDRYFLGLVWTLREMEES